MINKGVDNVMRFIGVSLIIVFFVYIFLFNLITGGNMFNTVFGIMTLSCISGLFLT
ncbi:MAG: hypothetical protein MJ224_07420 [archaeon]|nr:hypothetical protein [archaeon]